MICLTFWKAYWTEILVQLNRDASGGSVTTGISANSTSETERLSYEDGSNLSTQGKNIVSIFSR